MRPLLYSQLGGVCIVKEGLKGNSSPPNLTKQLDPGFLGLQEQPGSRSENQSLQNCITN